MDVPLAANDITVAQILKKSGYHTGLIGEWDLGGEGTGGAPWHKGFDEFAGYFDPSDAENYYADFIWRYAPGAVLNPTNHQGKITSVRSRSSPTPTETRANIFPICLRQAAVNFIKNNQPDRFNHFRPFFLLLNYKIPGGRSKAAEVPTDAPYSGEPWPQPEKNRAAMIARLDGCMGQLLEQLQKINQTNNTVIFFTSDTGPQTNGGVNPKFFQSAGPFRGVRGEPLRRRPAGADDCALAGQNSRRPGQRFHLGGMGLFADGGGHCAEPDRRQTLTAFRFCRRCLARPKPTATKPSIGSSKAGASVAQPRARAIGRPCSRKTGAPLGTVQSQNRSG